MPADDHLIPRRNAPHIAIPPLPKIPFLFDRMHRHYQHHYKSILLVIVYSDTDEVTHMVEEFLTVFCMGRGVPLSSLPS